jgi:DNA-binding NarL/FixJ family response regulator
VDLILLDLTMPGVQGFSGLISLRAENPDIPVVIVSATEEPTVIRRAIEFGASGFIPKSMNVDSIGSAIEAVLAGDAWTPPDVDLTATEDKETADLVRRLGTLTPQQVRVLMMLSEGLLNKQIAYELGVSEATVKAHVSAILDKLGVDSRTQAVIAASGSASRNAPPRPAWTSRAGALGRQPVEEAVDALERLIRELALEAVEHMRAAGPERELRPVARGRPAGRHEQAVVEERVHGAHREQGRRHALEVRIKRRDVGAAPVDAGPQRLSAKMRMSRVLRMSFGAPQRAALGVSVTS